MKRIIITAVLTVAACFMFATTAYADEGFSTPSYNVTVNVLEDNTLEIQENINTVFNVYKHGIYRYIPQSGTAYMKAGGKEIEHSYFMDIRNMSVEDHTFDSYYEKGSRVIKIGDPDFTVFGPQNYRLSYKALLYDDKTDEYDFFYYNVIPTDWETSIGEAVVTINMPKSFDEKDVEVYAAAYGEFADTEAVSWVVNNETITIKTNEALDIHEGITVKVMLPEGYFVGERSTGWAEILLYVIGIIGALGAFLLWFFFGRDPKVVRTVEFYPPEGTTSADVGYIIDGQANKEDVISLIFYLAERGCLTIEESEEEEKDFIIHRKQDLPEGSPVYLQTFFEGLFVQGQGQSVRLSELSEDFYPYYAATLNQLSAEYQKKSKKLFTSSGNIARRICEVIGVGASLACMLLSIFAGYQLNLIYIIPFPVITLALSYLISMAVYDRKDVMKKGKKIVLKALAIIFFLFSVFCTFGIVYPTTGIISALLVIVAMTAGYFCTRYMKKRTKLGAQLLGKILGLKEFIRLAELDRLKKLVEDDPSYFYNILPYAYVLGLSDKWAKKFEGIAVPAPDWYYGNYNDTMFNTWLFIGAFRNCTSSFVDNIVVPDSAGIGGGGLFGGGGGFSGGGFGGGGGGSW